VEAQSVNGTQAPRLAQSRPSARAFRDAVGTFATGVTVVSTVRDGVDHAMTANAFTSVSLRPLLVLVCVAKIARFHEALLPDGELGRGWAVSVLGADSQPVAERLARRGRPLLGQLHGLSFSRGAHTNAPIFDDALAALECRTHAIHDGGDHSIVLGEVLSVVGPRASGTPPLLFYRGDYAHLSGDDFHDAP
jgi:flavin reductase (DIM6/NTAB) family NADH-FMN oxidoreductase RutF